MIATPNGHRARDNQIAMLRAHVATMNSKKATLDRAQADLRRGEESLPSGGVARRNSISGGKP